MESRRRAKTTSREVPPIPSEQGLREIALAALARRAFTRVGMHEHLESKLSAWAKRATRGGKDAEEAAQEVERARLAVETVVARLVEVGLIDDASFAKARAGRLARAGKSKRATLAHLSAQGVSESTLRDAVAISSEDELRAAVILARKKRLGPFARERDTASSDSHGDPARQKALAAFARAGFSYSVADRALRMDLEEAESRIQNRGSLDD